MVHHLLTTKPELRTGRKWRSRWAEKVDDAAEAIQQACSRGLRPTPYFVEAWHYWHRARELQMANLKMAPTKVECDLQNHIPIYDTVRRRYAGFSNVLEQLWYGSGAPKYKANRAAGRDYHWVAGSEQEWMYICLVHRITGSGASFEHDHGWRNTIVPEMAKLSRVGDMAKYAGSYDGPMFTSIGNQIPPFNKKVNPKYRTAGQEYLKETAPELVAMMRLWLDTWVSQRGEAAPIKDAVDAALLFQKVLGHKQFKFVLTAWVMDLAEYLPHLVDPTSDCYHGKNAQEALEVCLVPIDKMSKQEFYDRGTRLFSDLTGTHPMDVEDAAPGCDLIRWLENYVPKKGFDHVHDRKIFNCSSLIYRGGRQPE